MRVSRIAAVPAVIAGLVLPAIVSAHCDTLDGPVVTAARKALDTGAVEPVLAWVQPSDEAEIRAALASARDVRSGSRRARELADRWFFETVVRVHRAGEGAPYDGLKPAGQVEPAVALADRAIASGDARQLEDLLVSSVREGLHAQLARVRDLKPPAGDVTAGRRWVAAYVPFVHWVENVHSAASVAPAEHGAAHAEAGGAGAHGADAPHAAKTHAH